MSVAEAREEEEPLMNAEEATRVAVEFLRSLGVKKTKPNKASNDGDRAYVEFDLKGRKVSVVVDGRTKEIIEYEIEKPEKRLGMNQGSISLKLILLVIGIQFLLMILFDFIKPYLPFNLIFSLM